MTGRRAAVATAVLGAVALATALVLLLTTGPPAGTGSASVPVVTAGTVPSHEPTTTAAPGGPPAAPAGPPAAHAVAPPAADARLRLDRLDLDARVVRVRLRGSTMQVPRDPRVIGWWSQGAAPGAEHGSAVLVGHVDYAGQQGAFASLPSMRPGDVLRLTDPGRRFRVAAVRTYPKTTGLPQQLFATSGPPQLVLITCGGSFDPHSGNYRDNIVVYAEAI